MSTLLEQASLVMIPSGYKEDVVYSQIPTSGSGDLSFTRASNGTRINSAGLVEDCPWNLAQQSETFNVSPWTNYGTGTITANATTAPNGTTTADLFVPNTTNYTHAVEQNIGTTSGVITMSVYAKAAGYNWLVLNTYVGGAKYTYFDLQNGVIGTTASGVTASIENVGNGWFKLICTLTGGASTYFSIISATANNTSSFAGNGTSGIYIWGAQLNIGSTAKPYFPTTDRLNVPRLTYQNGGGGCPSLLLEKQSTNLVPYSEQFDNSANWSYSECSVTANQAISPDGTQNADKLIESSANTIHEIYKGLTLTSGTTYTNTIYAKSAERTQIAINFVSGGFGQGSQVIANLSNGTLGSVTNYGGVTGSSATIQNMGNGWYRISLTMTPVSTTTFYADYSPAVNGNAFYQGNGTSGIYIWGAQLEASSYPTSYIPTTSASATRVADACSKTGISSLIGQTEGVLFADVVLEARATQTYFAISSSATSVTDYIGISFRASTIVYEVVKAGVLQATGTLTNSSTGQFKLAIGYNLNDFVFYANGTQISTDNSGTVPTCNDLVLFNSTFSQSMPLKYNEVLLFKTRLTNAELASLTTL